MDKLISGRITVSGKDFILNGKKIFMTGVNTPWQHWNDFGGDFDASFWDKHFQELHEAGINSTRIWVNCDGAGPVDIDDDGTVKGVAEKHWQDLEVLFELADRHGIYVMATLLSFDHFKEPNKKFMAWRNMVISIASINSYIDKYVIPFCERFNKHESLWSIDLCNEPDWVNMNEEDGQIEWKYLCDLFAREAAAIHKHSDALVTIGFGFIKFNSDNLDGAEKDYGSNKYLQSRYIDEDAYVDFNSIHYYEWIAKHFPFPFDLTPEEFGMDITKPAVLGEFPAKGFEGNEKYSRKMLTLDCYESLYDHGWQGAFPWTSNGVDVCGDFTQIEPAVKEFRKRKNL